VVSEDFLLYSLYMRFEVLTASMNMTAFWDIASYSLRYLGRHFRGAYCVHHQGHDDGGSTHLWNDRIFQRHCMAQYPRKLSSCVHSSPSVILSPNRWIKTTTSQAYIIFWNGWTLWNRSLFKCYLRIQSVPQREHHTSPLQRSTG
jgi:hypothetical protein